MLFSLAQLVMRQCLKIALDSLGSEAKEPAIIPETFYYFFICYRFLIAGSLEKCAVATFYSEGGFRKHDIQLIGGVESGLSINLMTFFAFSW